MKKQLVFAVALLMLIAACSKKEEAAQPAESVTDTVSVTETVTQPEGTMLPVQAAAPAAKPEMVFNNETFTLASAQASSNEVLNEYLPAGQTFDNYTRMMALQTFQAPSSADEYVNTFETHLKAMPESVSDVFTFSDPVAGTRGISFFVEGNGMLEYNLFNFRKPENGNLEGVHYVARLLPGEYQKGSPQAQQFMAQFAPKDVWQRLIQETPFPPVFTELPMQPQQPAAQATPLQTVLAEGWDLLNAINKTQNSYFQSRQVYASDPVILGLTPGETGNQAQSPSYSFTLFEDSLVMKSKDSPVTFVLFYGGVEENPAQLNACYDSALPEVAAFAGEKGLIHCRKK